MNTYILKIDAGYAVCVNENVHGTVKATLAAARAHLRRVAGRERRTVHDYDNYLVTATYGTLPVTGVVIEAYRTS